MEAAHRGGPGARRRRTRARLAAEQRAEQAGFADLLEAAGRAARHRAAGRTGPAGRGARPPAGRAQAALAEPELADLGAAPDLDGARGAVRRRAPGGATTPSPSSTAPAAAPAGLDGLAAEVTASRWNWTSGGAAFEQVSALADLVNGRGANTLRMRLQSFVLAARLEQVAEVASRRLQDMSGGRYTFLHSDAQGRNGARGGLGLDVLDEYTGACGPTKTLSGGESFMASLALALGLADVVTAESGGVQMDTLFVDEGFGTLDAAGARRGDDRARRAPARRAHRRRDQPRRGAAHPHPEPDRGHRRPRGLPPGGLPVSCPATARVAAAIRARPAPTASSLRPLARSAGVPVADPLDRPPCEASTAGGPAARRRRRLAVATRGVVVRLGASDRRGSASILLGRAAALRPAGRPSSAGTSPA